MISITNNKDSDALVSIPYTVGIWYEMDMQNTPALEINKKYFNIVEKHIKVLIKYHQKMMTEINLEILNGNENKLYLNIHKELLLCDSDDISSYQCLNYSYLCKDKKRYIYTLMTRDSENVFLLPIVFS